MSTPPKTSWLQRITGLFATGRRALALVWVTSPRLTVVLGVLTLLGGVLPAGIALAGRGLVDAVVAANSGASTPSQTLKWLALEASLVLALAGIQRGLDAASSLLRALLGQRVNVLLLEKALTLELAHFEDATLYDRLTRARREASTRPLSLVRRTFGIAQNAIALVSSAALLWALSPWVVGALALASLPAFVAETRFSGEAFRLFSWRTPDTRRQSYLEMVVAREDFAKEVKLLGIGPRLVGEYQAIFDRLFGDDRALTLRRARWGFALGGVATTVLYAAYTWVVWRAALGLITLGTLTLALLVLKQGQSAFSALLQGIAGIYEDDLYLTDLYGFLEEEVTTSKGVRGEGPTPADGLRFEGVWFTYPGAEGPALRGLDLHVPPGSKLALVGHNGSGKTTLVKLMTGLYQPERGRVLLDGLDLREWSPEALRSRVAVVFQDFVRYQFTVGENIGLGDVKHADDAAQQERAAVQGMAWPDIQALPDGLKTQLGRWFPGGRELSGGQWQKVALSRAFMRTDADILVLDEPTAAMDAEAEAEIFSRLAELSADRIALLISHRFSTVRMADHIVVLDAGHVIEEGSHDELMALDGRYAHLFSLQAEGYR